MSKKHLSRREVLKYSAQGYSAMMMSPVLFGLFKSGEAKAAISTIPFAQFVFSGGFGNQAVFRQIDENGAFFSGSSLAFHGVNAAATTVISPVNSNLYDVSNSGFVQGLLSPAGTTTPATSGNRFNAIAALKVVRAPHVSQNDTSTDKFASLGLLLQNGVTGSILDAAGTGTFPGSGGLSIVPNPGKNYGNIQTPNDFLAAAALSSVLPNNPGLLVAVATALQNLTSVQLSGRTPNARAQALADQHNANYQTLVGKANPTGPFTQNSMNPVLSDASATTIFGLTTTNSTFLTSTSANDVWGTMARNVIQGACGPIHFQRGGGDYHGQATTNIEGTNGPNFAVGQLIGNAFEYAASVGKPLCILLTSDGGLSANPIGSTNKWAGDDASMGCHHLLIYDPAGQFPSLSQSYGNFQSSNGVVNNSYPTGTAPELATALMCGFYLIASGMYDPNKFASVLSAGGVQASTISAIQAILAGV